jgi:hypothetical protein
MHSWEAGDPKLRNKNLPDDKQFLVRMMIIYLS